MKIEWSLMFFTERGEAGLEFPPLVLQPPPLGDVLDGEQDRARSGCPSR